MNDILEHRAKREGRVTPRACVENLMQAIEMGLVDSVVFVARQPNGEIKVGWSDTLDTEIIGLLECGKHMVIREMER
ncbi:MAG: hypothetical protein C6W55_10315 [Thermobacillus sp.]|nr:MAG: hypothetical protein C6W55_10315 [Thermobacillus sp.]